MNKIAFILLQVLIFGLTTSCVHLQNTSPQLPFSPIGDGETKDQHFATSSKSMVVSQGTYSTKAGVEMLNKGGNAIDAAVAVSFTISVERPQSTGIGGGGFLLYAQSNKDVLAWDFRERAPIKSRRNMYLDEAGNLIPNKSIVGSLAIATPGLVKGLIEIHSKFGRLPLKTVMRPAIDLAKNGFSVYPDLAFALSVTEKSLAQFESTRKIFFKNNRPIQIGDQLIQTDLAKSLELIAESEGKTFYEGPLASSMIASIQKHNGILSKEDLKSYKVISRKPLSSRYQDLIISTMPPPSSGGVHVVEILNILKHDKYPAGSVENISLTASAMQQAFADRAQHLGDPDFVKVPTQKLMSLEYAAEIRSRILPDKARPSETVLAGKFDITEPDHTTHFSIIDSEGNAVSSTQTINGFFGSSLVAEGTGIVLNNEMDDFSAKPGASNLFGAIGGSQNEIAPMKTPLSSMSPTIITKDGKIMFVVGSPSGTRILTCVASVIRNYYDFNMPLYDAVSTIRYHHQWSPDLIRVDEPGFSAQLKSDLENRGFKVETNNLGCRVQAIAREGNALIGVSDPRGLGMARGE